MTDDEFARQILRVYLIAHAPPVPAEFYVDARSLHPDPHEDARLYQIERVLQWPAFWADEQIKRMGDGDESG